MKANKLMPAPNGEMGGGVTVKVFRKAFVVLGLLSLALVFFPFGLGRYEAEDRDRRID